MKIIAVVVNKNWEVEPVLNALTSSELVDSRLMFPEMLNSPKDGKNKMNTARAQFTFKDSNGNVTLCVSIWCIQDLMYYQIKPDSKTQSSSSSEEKYRVLPPILLAENPDLVIAVGTAGYPSETSYNGSVVIGANFFIHNGNPDNPKSRGELNKHPDIGKVLLSNINDSVFDLIDKTFKLLTEPKFIKTVRNPAANAVCIASKAYASLGSINVTDYSQYSWVDHEAVKHYEKSGSKLPLSSIETTHGVIKLSTDKPILFVSAIADRLGHFDDEVNPTQNYIASFNAGIVLGQLFCSLNDFVLRGNNFEKPKTP